jgi:hypothetical protein
MTCPWYITAHAIERYQELVPQASRDFEAARGELVDLAAGIWERYARNQDLAPTVTRTGAYQYRGPGPLRLVVVVSPRPARPGGGNLAPMVDVVGADLRSSRSRRGARRTGSAAQ